MANYCTWNPSSPGIHTFADGNLIASVVQGTRNRWIMATMGISSGIYYWEQTATTISGSSQVGLISEPIDGIEINTGEDGITYQNTNGVVQYNGSTVATLSTWTTNDVIGILLDNTNGRLYFSKNDSWMDGSGGGASSATVLAEITGGTSTSYAIPTFVGTVITNKTWIAAHQNPHSGTDVVVADFGQNGYAGTAPSNSSKLNSSTLPTVTIENPSLHFSGIGYTGNGEGQRVGGFIPFTDSKTVADSARFDDGGPDYLERTFGSGGDVKTWTFSCWIKRTALGATNGEMRIFGGPSQASHIYLTADDKIYWDVAVAGTGASTAFYRRTTRVFQNTSRWFNLVCAYDTDQGTASDRMRIYIDGAEITEGTSSYPGSAYADNAINTAGVHSIGRRLASQGTAGMDLDCYMAEVVFIDAAQLTPSSFGQTDTSTNRWIPKDVSGLTFGTTGFYLNMTDGNDFGDDESGNTNDWTESGFDTTNGSNQMYDTPTRGFPTFSPSSVFISDITLQEGNTRVRLTSANADCCSIVVAPIPSTGVYYWEFLALNTGSMYFGVSYNDNTLSASAFNQGWFIGMNGSRYDPSTGSGTSLFSALSAGDMIGMAYNADLGALYYSINGAWMNAAGSTGSSATVKAEIEAGTATTNAIFTGVVQPALIGTNNITATSVLMPAVLDTSYGAMATLGAYANMGAWRYLDSGALTYSSTADGYFQSTTIPTNAKSLNQDNLATTTAGVTAFNLIKSTSAATNNVISDRLTGPEKFMTTKGPTATQQDSNTGVVQAFLQSGVQIGNYADLNTNDALYNSFSWAGGGAGATSSPAGTIASTVTVNTTAGFSVITYTGTGSAGTIGHGLGVAPACIWVAMRSNAYGWVIYHQELGNTSFIRPFKSDAVVTGSTFWNSTTPIANTFSVGTDDTVNLSSSTFVAFAFTEIEGYSKFGSYKGNGNADGPFIYTGFCPELVIYKNYSTASTDWRQSSTVDYPGNPVTNCLFPNLANASSAGAININSNGFKIINSDSEANGDGNTFIYMAWAKHPFAGSNVAQGKAR